MTTAERIDSILKMQGKSRRQLAISAGIPPSSLQSAMERNKNYSFDMLEKIARALNLTVADIVGNEGSVIYSSDSPEGLSQLFDGFRSVVKEEAIIQIFRRLNDMGQDVALDRMMELTEIPKYKKNHNSRED